MSSFNILNTLVITSIIISACIIYFLDELLPCIIAMAVLGAFVSIEFLFLGAPDVAMAEGAVGAVLTPVIFIVALSKIKNNKKGGDIKK
ncbi:Na(+)/H(+) antiporter subunit B [Clostridium sp.]|uniref:Na(+)/H(+) antiporter subunit B n=1 Tax=Clostridium sp. TaxID=1506 RepID=UPI002FC8DB86